MIIKKTYYSISEVSKMLNIQEHTIRFWNSKLPDLSKRDNKAKTRFFNLKQIEKLSKLNDILKKNDSITLANKILSKTNNYKSNHLNQGDSDEKKNNSKSNQQKMNNLNNFTREDIAESLHSDFGLTKKDCIIFVNDIIDIIIEGLKTNGYVKIHNFGSFKVTRKKSRIGRNPKTMEDVIISERNVLKFKPSKMILDYINKHNNV